jgi:hypothetical protein
VPNPRTAAATVAATEANQRYAAERHINDPVKLARAVRLVRTAIARGRLTLEEVAPRGDAA